MDSKQNESNQPKPNEPTQNKPEPSCRSLWLTTKQAYTWPYLKESSFFFYSETEHQPHETLYPTGSEMDVYLDESQSTCYTTKFPSVEILTVYDTSLSPQHVLKMLISWTGTLTDLRLVGLDEHINSNNEWHDIFKQISTLTKLTRLSLRIGCTKNAIKEKVPLDFTGLLRVMSQLREFYISFNSRPGHFPKVCIGMSQLFIAMTHYRLRGWGLSLPVYHSELFHGIYRCLEEVYKQNAEWVYTSLRRLECGQHAATCLLPRIVSTSAKTSGPEIQYLELHLGANQLNRHMLEYLARLPKLNTLVLREVVVGGCDFLATLFPLLPKDDQQASKQAPKHDPEEGSIVLDSVQNVFNYCANSLTEELLKYIFPNVQLPNYRHLPGER